MQTEYDLVLRGGRLVDPSENLDRTLNLGVSGGIIQSISPSELCGKRILNCEGLIVAPGFVDCHIHEDLYCPSTDQLQRTISDTMLRMGVTTAIGGNCGIFPSSCLPQEYLEMLRRKGSPIHQGLLVPAILLRQMAGQMDLYAPVSEEQLAIMRQTLKEQLQAGCLGLSLGLQYAPGTDWREVYGLMSVASEERKTVAVHIRDEGPGALKALEEVLDAALQTGAMLQISHLSSMCGFGQMLAGLAIIRDYRRLGVQVGFDCYPYEAYCTAIGSACFDGDFLSASGYTHDDYGRLQVVSGSEAGKVLDAESFQQIRAREPEALVAAHLMNEEEVELAITQEDCVVASDGIYQNGLGHPRGSGSFPRLFQHYVRERKVLTLAQAISKVTWQPARIYSLDKGTLKIGADADITIFNPDSIEATSNYFCPTQPPKGIKWVLVRGNIALENEHLSDRSYGTPLFV